VTSDNINITTHDKSFKIVEIYHVNKPYIFPLKSALPLDRLERGKISYDILL
jgi:hypothetical protein